MNRFGFYDYYHLNKRSESYTVKKGDTLYKIAQTYGIDVSSLMNANNLSSTQIYPNQIIAIPVQIGNGSMYFEEYIIESNDTLQDIASKLGISIEAIAKYNDITKLLLVDNQILNIPKTYQTYTIKEDDTLASILEATGMTLEQLVNANSSKWLKVGNKIYVV